MIWLGHVCAHLCSGAFWFHDDFNLFPAIPVSISVYGWHVHSGMQELFKYECPVKECMSVSQEWVLMHHILIVIVKILKSVPNLSIAGMVTLAIDEPSLPRKLRQFFTSIKTNFMDKVLKYMISNTIFSWSCNFSIYVIDFAQKFPFIGLKWSISMWYRTIYNFM